MQFQDYGRSILQYQSTVEIGNMEDKFMESQNHGLLESQKAGMVECQNIKLKKLNDKILESQNIDIIEW